MERAGVEVRDGREYDHLFPLSSGKTIIIKSEDAGVEDTLKLIKRTVAETLDDTKEIAGFLKGNTLEETCSNIWHFVFNHIKYKKDEAGKEQVRRPSRTWANRHEGVDCDCMSEFISSILSNLNIPHKHRIAMYNPDRGWQHIYPVVPKSGNLRSPLKNRKDYIVLDCVKYNYDDEEPFIKIKDYDMRLEYLNGPEEEEEQMYEIPQSTDIYDLASASDIDDAELGKIGQWLKKTVKKAGTVVKKVGDAAGKGIRTINKVANPVTILLRNGFLLAMQTNMMKVAEKLKYAYLTDAQAKAKGINLTEFAKLKKIKEKAESIFWQAGGDKNNLKKAILTGKGNTDRSVPMSGLEGIEDPDEYTAMLNGDLGVAPAAALAAATAAVTAISGALSQVKGLFNKPASAAPSAPVNQASNTSTETYSEVYLNPVEYQPPPQAKVNISNLVKNVTAKTNFMPSGSAMQNANSNTTITASASNVPASIANEGMFQGTMEWLKANPGKSLLIAAAIGGGTYLLLKKKEKESGKGKAKGLKGLRRRIKSKSIRGNRGKIKVISL